MIEAVDLFCGAGGLTAGLRRGGVRVRAGFDIDSTCAYPYIQNNHTKFILEDVGNVTAAEVLRCYTRGSIRLLAGCAPCQPFSTYNQGRDAKNDNKWPLLSHFARLIRATFPALVTMENVPDVTRHEVYHHFVETLERTGYYIWAGTVSCADYGVPQHRHRHVLLGSKLGPVQLIPPTHAGKHVTVREVISDLRALESGGQDPNDRLHKASRLSTINLRRIRASKPGGTWRDWPEGLRAQCHRKASGRTYSSVYGRMAWDEPGPTVTTLCYGFGNGRFGHPSQDRAITLREAAILQSFPSDYVFLRPGEHVYFRSIGRLIGNAVPVRLGEVIAKSLRLHVRRQHYAAKAL